MSDPLLVLRDTFLQNVEQPLISYFDSFGNTAENLSTAAIVGLGAGNTLFNKTAETNFKSKRGAGAFYTLDAAIFLILHRDDSYSVYLQEARGQNIPVVSLVDKKEMIDYLSAPGAECPYVDLTAPLVPNATFEDKASTSPPPAASSGAPASARPSSSASKKAHHHRHHPKAATVPVAGGNIILPNGMRAVQIRKPADLFTCDNNFAGVIELGTNMLKKLEQQIEEDESKASTGQATGSLVEQISSLHSSLSKPKKETQPTGPKRTKIETPIIIVPNAPSSLINIYNIKDLLEGGSFVPPAEAKSKATQRESRIKIHHDGREFIVVDSPASLSADEWSAVMAIFVTNAAWQFKGWPVDNPVDLFQRHKGFYATFEDLKIEEPVASWRVHRLLISRNKRHLDSSVSFDFWTKCLVRD
jgi:parafibromin